MDLRKIVRNKILIFEALTGIENINLDQSQINEILKGYLEAALWTEEERLNDEYQQSLGYKESDYEDGEDDGADEIELLIRARQKLDHIPNDTFRLEELEIDSQIQAYVDIKNFITMAGKSAIAEAISENGLFKLGMDIWLTRNHHGSGFFDHNYNNEEILTKAAHNLREVDLYITDNNTLKFINS